MRFCWCGLAFLSLLMNGCTEFTVVGSSSRVESFDAIHYAGLAVYKIGIILLNLVPLIALCMVS
jgi:hypothetical protein